MKKARKIVLVGVVPCGRDKDFLCGEKSSTAVSPWKKQNHKRGSRKSSGESAATKSARKYRHSEWALKQGRSFLHLWAVVEDTP